MKRYLYRLLVALGLAVAYYQLTSCSSTKHSAQAPRQARHTYRQAERQHTRARRRTIPLYLPWN